jgi:hypothetical protein
MACPYFAPAARLDNAAWAVPPRLPLLDAYDGECRASESPAIPDARALQRSCNIGYASADCARFPADAEADAIRFHIATDADGRLRLQYVLEKSCWPVRHGFLDYAEGAFAPHDQSEILARQAAAFISGYLRRRDA